MCIVLYVRVTYLGREEKLLVSILYEFRCADKMGLYVQKIYWGGEQDAGLTPVKRKTREDDWVEGVSNCNTVSKVSARLMGTPQVNP